MRVDQTNLTATLGVPKVSYGASTGILSVPTLVWPIPTIDVHITIYPDDAWKFNQMQIKNDLDNRRAEALARDEKEAETVVQDWRDQGKSDQEIEQLTEEYLAANPLPFDDSLEDQPVYVADVTFDEWHVTDTSGSVFFNEQGVCVKSDAPALLEWARQNAGYFANLGLTVLP